MPPSLCSTSAATSRIRIHLSKIQSRMVAKRLTFFFYIEERNRTFVLFFLRAQMAQCRSRITRIFLIIYIIVVFQRIRACINCEYHDLIDGEYYGSRFIQFSALKWSTCFFKMSIVEKLEPSFCHKCAVPSPNSQAQQTTLTPQSSKKRAVCWGGWRFSGGRQRESFPRCRCSLHWSQPHPLPPTRRLPCVSPNPYRLPSPPPTRDAARLICFAQLMSLLPCCCKDRYAFSICSWFCVESLLLVFFNVDLFSVWLDCPSIWKASVWIGQPPQEPSSVTAWPDSFCQSATLSLSPEMLFV
jgi:hypothetical protein